MFLRRIDEVLGMRKYRPVDLLGQPRLEIEDEGGEVQQEKIEQEQSAYRVHWKHQRTKVGNVAHVKKMRKFEPLRKQVLQERAANAANFVVEDVEQDTY